MEKGEGEETPLFLFPLPLFICNFDANKQLSVLIGCLSLSRGSLLAVAFRPLMPSATSLVSFTQGRVSPGAWLKK